ncbi:hypothetical protein [Rhizobium jaguaris]|uniref:Uncharacterized protein n=1 Tax=Rhizobium jaguaris TaxID=1312183 RepID=A0A387G0S7_9HYPH|nr:hypothetical protein [Rhizobium jaguaris]AYG64529.1 hypothetical protein CCGE525_38120 [Rhizobium jaguaris]
MGDFVSSAFDDGTLTGNIASIAGPAAASGNGPTITNAASLIHLPIDCLRQARRDRRHLEEA